jgi:hypothetical protein
MLFGIVLVVLEKPTRKNAWQWPLPVQAVSAMLSARVGEIVWEKGDCKVDS